MKLVGLELNAKEARAVIGASGDYPALLHLDPPHADLPLILNLEKSALEIGRSGSRVQRQLPHVVCHDFLPHVGEAGLASRRWKHNRHRLDAAGAMTAVWKHLHAKSAAKAAVVSVPAYMTAHQIDTAVALAQKARFPVRATISSPLAAAVAAYAEQTWFGYGLVLDVDTHALTISTIRVAEGRAEFIESQVLPHLCVSVWKERLLNALADACVLQSRRDPRASPQAEQGLFDQLDIIIDAGGSARAVQIGIEARQWYQNLVVQPEHPVHVCRPLVQPVIDRLDAVWNAPWPEAPPGIVLLTAEAGRLPGLADAIRTFFAERSLTFPRPAFPSEPQPTEDFGEGLIQDARTEGAGVVILAADALARAAHFVAGHFHRAEWQPLHLEDVALPSAQSVETGPARIQFQGQDYLVSGAIFAIGRHGCDLTLANDAAVAERHCEIIHERRCYMIVDCSRDGTLVNGVAIAGKAILRAGDWVRLGPEGPLLRFLGRDRTQSTIVRA